jgi:hypothetical protein
VVAAVSAGPFAVNDEVIVYRLLDPPTVVRAAADIEAAIVSACPIAPVSPQFALSAQGCVRFTDRGARRQRSVPGLLPQSDRVAATIARDFLRRASGAVRDRTGGRIADLFQLSTLEHGVTRRVLRRTTGEMDHWLSTWVLRLPSRPSGAHQLATVFGGTIQVRIGAQGRILGLVSGIRPIVGRLIRPAFALPGASTHGTPDAGNHGDDHEHSDDHDGHEHAGEAPHAHRTGEVPIVVYVLEGPDAPQRFLSPCFVDPAALENQEGKSSGGEGHDHGHSNLLPACDHTLLARLIVEQGEREARVQVVLQGAGGTVVTPSGNANYRMIWAVATQDEFAEGEYAEDEAAVLQLPAPAIYHVEVTVEHMPTEAIVTTYEYIPVPGKQELPELKDRAAQPRVG